MDTDVASKHLVLGVLVERIFSQILPTAFGGDAARATFLIGNGSAASISISSIFFDRIVGIVGLVILAGLFAPLAALAYGSNASFALVGLAGILVISAIAVARLVRTSTVESLAARIPVNGIVNLIVMGHRLFHRRRFYTGGIGISCAVQLVFCAIFGLLAVQDAGNSGAIGVAILSPMVLLSGILPFTVGGWGVREGAAAFFFQAAGLSVKQALGLSVEFGLVQLVVGALSGLALLVLLVSGSAGTQRAAAGQPEECRP
jgi:uncharacterized membrane protein YbhN (UPF0104 family)